MSSITTIYDELRSIVGTTLSTYTELNNAYVIEDESDLFFDSGWALALGSGNNTNRVVGCKKSYQRQFILTLTHRVFNTDRDLSARLAGEKVLFEDQAKVISAIENSPSSTTRTKTDFVSDNGLEFLSLDRFGIYVLQSTISIEYLESL